MESSDWHEQIACSSNGCDQLTTLFETDDEINVQSSAHGVLLRVQLTRLPPDMRALHTWLRLGQSSLEHFQGALAQAPASGHLWLLQRLPGQCSQATVLAALEKLLNQRDTWRSVCARLIRTVNPHSIKSLRTLPH